ncbi:MAG: CPBP family intramembrane metalloprotease [Spirosomaceae bacterium]|nr:CPBP family intramembrane metalloprotease [Spirosomataceae bacterium]
MHPKPAHSYNERPAFSSILMIIGFVLIGMALGQVLFMLVVVLIGGVGLNEFADLTGSLMQSPNGWLALMLGQAASSLFTFVFSGLLYWKLVERKKFSDFNFKPLPVTTVFLFAIIIQVFFLPFNGWLQAANQAMELPAALKGIEDFMRNMEDSLSGLTEFMTTFSTIPELILAFIVIAVIAGVGEEIIFRGLIQRKLQLGLKNPHAAIWIAAFIFSAIHFQFYGFLPRLMLGAMFGYFYYFTGNIWVPIVAHIFNNGLVVILLYLSHQKLVSADLEKMDNVPFAAGIASFFLALGMMWFFRKYIATENQTGIS